MSKVKLLLDVVEDLRSLADSVQAVAGAMLRNEEPDKPAETKPQEDPKPAAAPKKEITLEQVRAVLAEKSHDGLTAEVRELLQKYGAQKLSGVDPKHYASLLKDAEGLKNAT
ncbi:MAG: rRNA biogenesis protein rrp5 [Anaerotruncus rubiinfantis]